MDYDVVVIGGGAGGLGAARAAVGRGARTLLVDRGPLGGECTFTGCVPSKALIEAADRGADFADAMAAVHASVASIAATEDDEALQREGVDVMHGSARLRGPGVIDIDGTSVTARRIVLATGTGPAIPPIDGLDEVAYLTNETVFDLTELPRSLAVVGGGAIGCELAQAFARLGSHVTVIEAADRLLAGEDRDASIVVASMFAASGIVVRTGCSVVRAESAGVGGAATLRLDNGDAVAADAVLVAVGRTPSTDALHLDAAGVRLDDRGFVRANAHLRTTVRGVFAVGDVTGLSLFTHAADEMGRVAAANALRRWPQRRFRAERMPRVTYTDPEVAHVGLSEADVAARGGRVSFVPMTAVDRAVTAGRTEGFVKLMVGPRLLTRNLAGGRILGATVDAPRAGEILHELVLAIRTGMFPARIALTVHAYPTWSAAVRQAAAQLFIDVNGRRAEPARPHGHLSD
ncbi:MAG: FAD-dependent oxidoreductase [Actinobacteria bacterium]|nr:FAD-dependent oxidoreductase [Actinomycetota bacterium]